VVYGLWFIMEVAIAATDLAEVIGSAVALNLLFHIPIWAGVIITGADVLFIIIFGTKSFRFLEVLIMCLCAVSSSMCTSRTASPVMFVHHCSAHLLHMSSASTVDLLGRKR